MLEIFPSTILIDMEEKVLQLFGPIFRVREKFVLQFVQVSIENHISNRIVRYMDAAILC